MTAANKPRGWIKHWVMDWVGKRAKHGPTGLVVCKVGSRLTIEADTLEQAQAALQERHGAEHLAAKVRHLVDQAGQLLDGSVSIEIAAPAEKVRRLSTQIPLTDMHNVPEPATLTTHIEAKFRSKP